MTIVRLFMLIALAAAVRLGAQPVDARLAPTQRPLEAIASYPLPPLDNKQLQAAEATRRGPGIAPRFAETIEVALRPETHGSWEQLADGREVWRLRLQSPGAHSLNLGFSAYTMPAGGSLILYQSKGKEVIGPFTPADNEEHAELWTPILPGDDLIVEVQLAAGTRSALDLEIKTINHDFVGFSLLMSGSCNLDVICGAADGWGIVDQYRDIIQSVAVIGINGNTFCTGFLVNNTRQDCRPFFMTANHCGINAGNSPSLVVYWNYINSVCRQPGSPASGGPGNGLLTDFNTGSLFRAAHAPSDMTLVELDDPVSPTADAFFAGWSAVNTPAQDTIICVHHPSTDEKRISFEFDGTYVGNWGSGSTPVPTGNHLIVADWDIGTTEGGSSGSPLFNSRKQVIGQLHGGAASCNNNSYDSYGWMYTSWEGGGSPQSRLKDWLDPDNSGQLELDGRYQLQCSYYVLADPPAASLCAPDSANFQLTVGETFEDNVSLSFPSLPEGLVLSLSDTTAAPGALLSLTIGGTENVPTGTYLLNLQATDGTNTAVTTLVLTITNGLPAAVNLIAPLDAAADQPLSNQLVWQNIDGAAAYDWQFSDTVTFSQLLASGTGVVQTSAMTPPLEILTTYYWRVRASNQCGDGEWSAVYSFTTGEQLCLNLASPNVPLSISSTGTPTVNSVLSVGLPGNILSIRVVDLSIQHTYIGDLSATLTSPAGTTIELFNRPGTTGAGFGCDGEDLLVTFDDVAPNNAAAFENACGATSPSIEGSYQPIQALAAFAGQPAAGEWRLSVRDNASFDGGSLLGWRLEFCTEIPSDVYVTTPETLSSCQGSPVSFDMIVGPGFEAPATISVAGLPAGAEFSVETNPALPGDTVSVTIVGLTAGEYSLLVSGQQGSDTASSSIDLIIDGGPQAPALVLPAQDAQPPLGPVLFQWSPVSGAQNYRFILSTQPDLSDAQIDALLPATTTSRNQGSLNSNTRYYWTVIAEGACPSQATPEVRTFTTARNLGLFLNNAIQQLCVTEEATYQLTLGPDFGQSPTVAVSTQPTASFSLEQSYNASTRILTFTLSDLFAFNAGSYLLTFVVSDELGNQNQLNTSISMLTAPGLSTLEEPAAGSIFTSNNITLRWAAVSNATSYRVEVSTDPSFATVLISQVQTALSYVFTAPEGGLYYWRVTASNSCGDAVTAARTVSYSPVSTRELMGISLQLYPNPTAGLVQLSLSSGIGQPVVVEIYDLYGRLLGRSQQAAWALQHTIDLRELPAGTYLLRLTTLGGALTERVVKK